MTGIHSKNSETARAVISFNVSSYILETRLFELLKLKRGSSTKRVQTAMDFSPETVSLTTACVTYLHEFITVCWPTKT